MEPFVETIRLGLLIEKFISKQGKRYQSKLRLARKTH